MERKEQQLDLIEKKNTHGGARPGAGRKKTHRETKVIRVPERYLDTVKALVDFLDAHSSDSDLNGSFTSPPFQHRTFHGDYRQNVTFEVETLPKRQSRKK